MCCTSMANLSSKATLHRLRLLKSLTSWNPTLLIINADGSQGTDGKYAIPQLVLKYNYTGQQALGWGVMSYHANDITKEY